MAMMIWQHDGKKALVTGSIWPICDQHRPRLMECQLSANS
jgi:hypothetical protein